MVRSNDTLLNAERISTSTLNSRLPLSGSGVPLVGNKLVPLFPPPVPLSHQRFDDFSILKIETKQASGEALPADIKADLAPGVQMSLGCRRVMRYTLFDAAKTNNTGTLPYCGLVQPAKEDIIILISEKHGIQTVYKKAGSVDEPILMDNEIPTVTTVSFMRLIIDSELVAEKLQRKYRRAPQHGLRRDTRISRTPPHTYESHDIIHAYFKRQREENEQLDRRAEKRARADHTKSSISFYAMGVATGLAVKYLL